MSDPYVIGLDVGNGHGACLLLNITTGESITAVRQWKHPLVQGSGGWGVNLDTALILRSIQSAIREVIHTASISREDIHGLGTTSMRHGLVVIDNTGHEIFAVPTRDARAASEATKLSYERGEEFYLRTGKWPLPIFAAPRLEWLSNQIPGDFQRAKSVLSISDWMNYRMTGVFVYERSLSGETLLVDLETNDWAWDLVSSLDLPSRIFPPIIPAGNQVGSLTESMADYLGLKAGLPVISGGGDTQSALLGLGVSPRTLGVVAGTTTPIQLVLPTPVIDQQYRLWTNLHLITGQWILESNVGQTGEILNWLASLLYPDAREPVPMLLAAANQSESGARGITSSFGASLFHAREMSVPVGNLTLSPLLFSDEPDMTRHVARAVLEGMAYGIRVNIQQLLDASKIEHHPIKLGGGMARSKLFAQILSNVCDAAVIIPKVNEVSAYGAAICAAAGIGLYSDLSTAANALSVPTQIFNPQAEFSSAYQQHYDNWLELQQTRAHADLIAGEIAIGTLTDKPESPSPSNNPIFRPRIMITASISSEVINVIQEFADVTHVDYREEMRILSGQDLVEELSGYHIFITEIDIVDFEALKNLPDLRVIFCCRGNPVNVDLEACTALGIPVLNTPGRNADAVADLTIAFMLMLARNLLQASQFLLQGGIEAGDLGRMGMAYESFQGSELWGKNIGLVGFGAIGRKVAARAIPFGARIFVFDPYISPESATLAGVESISLPDLLEQCDFVSIHAPVTPETASLIDAQHLAMMKPGAYLVNTARAALVDEQALFETLQSGHLAGAALDVFTVEPPGSDHPLLSLPNVIATPHIGGNTHEVAAHQGWIVKSEIDKLLTGRSPDHILNPETLVNFNWNVPRRSFSQEERSHLSQKPGPGVTDLEIKQRGSDSDLSNDRTPGSHQTPAAPVRERVGILSKVRSRISTEIKETNSMPDSTNVQQSSEKLIGILHAFVTTAASDPSLLEFSRDRDFTMHFVVTDLNQDFYLHFENGFISGDLTPPPSKPDLVLKMKADILDGMFTGRTNPTRAAMTGKIAFSGDTRKAMSMQKIQKDLTRLYTAARDVVGDPGDLTSLEESPQPIASATSQPISAPTTPSTSTMVGDERDELVQVLNELYHSGLITSTGGNISIRTSKDQSQAWITPSQIFKGDLRADMMVCIDMLGERLNDDALPASSERLVHCAVYRQRPDIQAIVHTHAPNTMILMLAGLPFAPISTETAFIGDIPVVPFIMPGTQELGDFVAQAIGDGVAVFMQNHGLVVGGSSLRRAADITEIIESTSEKLIMLALLGKEPPTLPADIVSELQQYKDLMA